MLKQKLLMQEAVKGNVFSRVGEHFNSSRHLRST